MGGTHIPTGGSAGNSSEPKRVVSPEPAMDRGGGKVDHPMTKSVEHIGSSPQTTSTVGAESDQYVNICSFVVCCDRMWPSTQ